MGKATGPEGKNMKKYYAANGSFRTNCGSEEKLNAYLSAHPSHVALVEHQWNSDEIRINVCESRGFITSEAGIKYPMEAAIDRNWHTILRCARMFGLSGYKLASAHIRRDGDKCIVTLKGWSTSAGLVGFDSAKHWSDEALLTREVVFDGVEDGDLHADEFYVELKK